MEAVRRLMRLLPEDVAEMAGSPPVDAAELRLRAGQRICWTRMGGQAVVRRGVLSSEGVLRAVNALSGHSLYAREAELAQGYFTLKGGCRVGVCGRYAPGEGGKMILTEIGSVNVRIAREVKGAADGMMGEIWKCGRPVSFLILSAPGMGKTTALRDAVRQLSARGVRVALADERGEVAACERGVPALDVGPNTDVMDGCPKRLAIPMLVRCMGPEMVATDELGGSEDAAAVLDAARCGVKAAATAHAAGLEDALRRPGLGELIRAGAFEKILILKGPGMPPEAVPWEKSVG